MQYVKIIQLDRTDSDRQTEELNDKLRQGYKVIDVKTVDNTEMAYVIFVIEK